MPHHGANRPFQSIPPFPPRQRRAFVTSAKVTQKHFDSLTAIKSAFAPYGVVWGLCPRQLRLPPPAGPPFEKGTLHPA